MAEAVRGRTTRQPPSLYHSLVSGDHSDPKIGGWSRELSCAIGEELEGAQPSNLGQVYIFRQKAGGEARRGIGAGEGSFLFVFCGPDPRALSDGLGSLLSLVGLLVGLGDRHRRETTARVPGLVRDRRRAVWWSIGGPRGVRGSPEEEVVSRRSPLLSRDVAQD